MLYFLSRRYNEGEAVCFQKNFISYSTHINLDGKVVRSFRLAISSISVYLSYIIPHH